MEATKKQKTFDAVKMMRECRDEISQDTQNMTFEQLKAYIKAKLTENNAKRVGEKQKPNRLQVLGSSMGINNQRIAHHENFVSMRAFDSTTKKMDFDAVFEKKSEKTPAHELKLAERLKKEYIDEKGK